MFEYPARWESDVVLADGGTARVRPSRPDDEPALLALYERLSDESIYLRFFSPVPRPTAVQLERITSIDYVDHMVLIAELGDDIVAVARYDRIAPDEAARLPAAVRPLLTATIGFERARLRARRTNLRGFPNDSK